jgi:V-type H+-transporting ATPase subunit E
MPVIVTREKSRIIKDSRTQLLEARNKSLVKILNEVQLSLKSKITSDKSFYEDLLTNLIVEGMVRMMEEEIYVYCLEKDKSVVSAILKFAKEKYQKIIKEQLGTNVDCNLTVGSRFLKERKLVDLTSIPIEKITKAHEQSILIPAEIDDQYCFGGVILKNKEHNIILKNTLDLRTELAFQKGLPEIRRILIPKN